MHKEQMVLGITLADSARRVNFDKGHALPVRNHPVTAINFHLGDRVHDTIRLFQRKYWCACYAETRKSLPSSSSIFTQKKPIGFDIFDKKQSNRRELYVLVAIYCIISISA